MAGLLIVPNYMPALDSNGNPSPGALLYTYDNETTTLKPTYTSAALTTPHTNPVVADASGVFPLLYVDYTEVYSVALTTSTGAQLKPPYDNVYPTVDDSGQIPASRVDFTPDVPSPTARTVQNKLEEVVSSLDLGLDPTGATSITTKFQAWHDALPSTGGAIHFTAGTYKIATAITLTKQVKITTDGIAATTFTTSMATGDVITLSGANYSDISDFTFTSSVTRTAGRFIYLNGNTNAHIHRFLMTKHYIGYELNNCYKTLITDGQLELATPEATSSGSAHIIMGGALSIGTCRIERVFTFSDPADPNNLAKMPGAGIIAKNCDGCEINGSDIIRSGIDLLINPGNSQLVNGLYLNDTFFDSANYGIVFSATGTGAIRGFRANACWTGNHQNDGVLINTGGVVGDPEFGNHDAFGNGLTAGNGLTCNRECGLNVVAGRYWANDGAGIGFAANIGDFTISGANCTDCGTGVGNDIGINVPAGTADNWTVSTCDVRNNVTTGLNYGGSGNNRKVWDVKGFVSYQSGSFVLPSASTTVTVNHGLGATPGVGCIMVTANTTWGNTTKFWVDTFTSTQFTFNANIAPGSDTAWGFQASLCRTH